MSARRYRRHGAFAQVQPQLAQARQYAAATTVAGSGPATVGDAAADRRKTPDAAWQAEAYDFADQIGELGYLLNLKSTLVGDSDLLPQQWDVEKRDWVETESADVFDVMAAWQPPQGGQRELKRRFGYHLSTAGETHLLGTMPAGAVDGIGSYEWEFLSTDELKIDQTGKVTRRRNGGDPEDVDPMSYLARCWRSNPRYSDRSDCEVRRVIDICKTILLLSQLVDAVAQSRLASGILFVPNEMSFVGQEDDDDFEDDTDQPRIDPFTRALLEHLRAPIVNRDDPAGVTPMVLRGAAVDGDKIRLIDIGKALDTWGAELRIEALRRMAKGLDAPPEIIEGKASLNHWGSWNVDADFVGKHIAPLVNLLADFVTVAYLRPMLEEYKGMTADQARQFRLAGDLSPITGLQDSGGAAERLHAAMLISDEATVRETGFAAADMPSPEELEQRRLWELIAKDPGVYAKLVSHLDGFEWVTEDMLNLSGGSPVGGGGGTAGTGVPPPPPEPTSQQDVPSTGPASMRRWLLEERLTAAADAAVHRTLEKAGARVISRAVKDVAFARPVANRRT